MDGEADDAVVSAGVGPVVKVEDELFEPGFAEEAGLRRVGVAAGAHLVADADAEGGGDDPDAHDGVGEMPGEDDDPAAHLGAVKDRVEGAGDADGFADVVGDDLRPVGGGDPAVEFPGVGSPGLHQGFRPYQLPQGGDAVGGETAFHAPPDAGELADGNGLDECRHLFGCDGFAAEGLGAPGGELGDVAGLGRPDGDGEAETALDLVAQHVDEAGDLLIFDPPLQIAVEFVDASLFDDRDARLQKGVQLPGEVLVELHVGRLDDESRALLQRFADGGPGVDAVLPRFVAGGGEDPPDAAVGVGELGHVVLTGVVGLEKGPYEGPAVFEVDALVPAVGSEDVDVPPSPDAHGFSDERRVDGTFGGDEKAVKVDMDFHNDSLEQQRRRIQKYGSASHACGEELPIGRKKLLAADRL